MTIVNVTVIPPIFGIGFAPRGYVSGMTGWSNGSIGYHSDDGICFNDDKKYQLNTYGLNDTVGICWNLSTGLLTLTKNGSIETQIDFKKQLTMDFLPTITTGNEKETFSINFGQKEFKWKIDGDMKTQIITGIENSLSGIQSQVALLKSVNEKPKNTTDRFKLTPEDLTQLEKEGKLEETLKTLKDGALVLESFIKEKQACVICLEEKKRSGICSLWSLIVLFNLFQYCYILSNVQSTYFSEN